MTSFFHYILQSAMILSALSGIYWLFLRKETHFLFNRIFLLLTLTLPFVLPLIPLRFSAIASTSPIGAVLDPVIITPEKFDRAFSSNLSLLEILTAIYLTGAAIFFVFFLMKLARILLLTGKSGFRTGSGERLVVTDRKYPPFSVFNYIFLHRDYLGHADLITILKHEREHIRQFHTFDLLLAELVRILQWFNPVAWMLGNSLKGVHEYLADEGVLRKGATGEGYMDLIVRESGGIQLNYLTNNFNVLSIKKRITMITKKRSAKWAALKSLFAIPAVLAVLLFFASPISGLKAQDKKSSSTTVKPASATGTAEQPKPASESQKSTATQPVSQKKAVKETPESTEAFTVVEEMPKYVGGQDAMIKFLVENVKYPEEAIKKNVQGKVFVTFTVKEDGTLSDVKVLRGIGSGCDEEAVRVVKLMPKWEPGKQRGKNVAVIYNLPIQFKLGDDKEKEKSK